MTRVASLPRVKICGITNLVDLQAALAAGAQAIGLVHHSDSARHVEPTTMRHLSAALPAGIPAVGVVVEGSPHELGRLARASGWQILQLCGQQAPEEWVDCALPIWRRVAVAPQAAEEIARWRKVASAFVLDHAASPGGSGQTVDWRAAAQLARLAPCLLAGGLCPENVAAAIHSVSPAGVDASSRLESAPGKKDAQRMHAFVRAALNAWSASKP